MQHYLIAARDQKDDSLARLLKIRENTATVSVETADGPVEIIRRKNDTQLIDGILQPITPVPGVSPMAELEVLDALNDPAFIVVDMRNSEWRRKGTIPGSVSIPFNEVAERLKELGCIRRESGWDCSGASKIVAFCNGPACPQSSIAIRAMIGEGFPPHRIYFYRGGMQDWIVLGLTTSAVPGSDNQRGDR
jgi:rhodanese-related sulfurtransferase